MMRKLILLKDLPGCPKGRIFKEDISGGFFHSMTDDEAISGNFIPYKFSKSEIEDNLQFFKEIDVFSISIIDLNEIIRTCLKYEITVKDGDDIDHVEAINVKELIFQFERFYGINK